VSVNEANEIANRIGEIQDSIADAARAAGRAPGDVTLLAVSKKQSAERVRAAYDAGLRAFGENYVQGLEEQAALLPADAQWHFIGHLQSKKAKRVAGVALVHSVDSLKLASKLASAAELLGRPLPCLLNINISNEDSKSGIVPDQALPLLELVAALPHIRVQGFMCIPSPDEEPRHAFSRLRELRDQAQRASGLPLPELSMGMSGDFADAIAEGSTIVRVGTAIFGPRNLP
tara:strand:+ start:44570 stop:45262 length:693 start_codon:yes stop_codon:yes gene_type:complete